MDIFQQTEAIADSTYQILNDSPENLVEIIKIPNKVILFDENVGFYKQ